MITVSIVSHGHGEMVDRLIEQLRNVESVSQIILTLNIPQLIKIKNNEKITIIQNEMPFGFGANHNNAFKLCTQPFFCVLNPDIELVEDPFPTLLECIKQQSLCLTAPIIVSSSGTIEDSARAFPTWSSLLRKLFFSFEGRWPLDLKKSVNYPDWVAGMFMLFTSIGYKEIDGFDTNYFLYYEDVDICRRIRMRGYEIGLCTKVKAIHDAQRTSRKNIKFLTWHLNSVVRFLVLSSKK
jgi:GT2 family glycosyltransferase